MGFFKDRMKNRGLQLPIIEPNRPYYSCDFCHFPRPVEMFQGVREEGNTIWCCHSCYANLKGREE